MNRIILKLIPLILCVCVMLVGCGGDYVDTGSKAPLNDPSSAYSSTSTDIDNIPKFDGEMPFVILNGNIPDFRDEDLVTESYEYYGELDKLGRCTIVIACVGKDIMPTEERGNIGQVKPTGWHTVKYENVDGKYLYNRCHLIGFQLTGENANDRNLITGTRYLNVEGMLPFENMIADYVKETENHVLYRVTPIFEGNNLLASGVQLEAKSVEDNGDGVMFNVYAYNVQPGVVINYKTGESALDEKNDQNKESFDTEYVLNTGSKKIHLPNCSGVKSMSEKNKKVTNKLKSELIKEGYSTCNMCNP
ncbi:MAG: DNA/RNA non-specific endonuclease [Clostridia bacterium]|nr:DNA/RNA non-specific endonuclease [Clostridia bacterium]